LRWYDRSFQFSTRLTVFAMFPFRPFSRPATRCRLLPSKPPTVLRKRAFYSVRLWMCPLLATFTPKLNLSIGAFFFSRVHLGGRRVFYRSKLCSIPFFPFYCTSLNRRLDLLGWPPRTPPPAEFLKGNEFVLGSRSLVTFFSHPDRPDLGSAKLG